MRVPNRSARLVAWSNAVALGLASPDLAAAEVVGSDPAHRIDGLPGGDGQTLPVLLARLRSLGVAGARLVLPVPGDQGVPLRPGALAAAAQQAGELALVPDPSGSGAGWGLVPTADTKAVTWRAFATASPDLAPGLLPGLPTLAEADRALAESLREATDVLDHLDVAAWDDHDADDLAALRSGRLDGDGLAPGYPERAVSVLVRARRLRTIVGLARRADGSALTAGEAAARTSALVPLDRAARHAEMAAYNVLTEHGPLRAGTEWVGDEPRLHGDVR